MMSCIPIFRTSLSDFHIRAKYCLIFISKEWKVLKLPSFLIHILVFEFADLIYEFMIWINIFSMNFSSIEVEVNEKLNIIKSMKTRKTKNFQTRPSSWTAMLKVGKVNEVKIIVWNYNPQIFRPRTLLINLRANSI